MSAEATQMAAKERTHEYIRADGEKVEYPDILIWVGASYYPTPEDFIAEARKMGISRRIAAVPEALEIGATRLFLAHPNALPNPDYDPSYDKKTDPKGERKHTAKPNLPGVFALTVIERVELIVGEDEKSKEKMKELEGQVHAVFERDVAMEPERGCGHRKVGGLYLVTDEDYNLILHSGAVNAINIRGGIGDIVPPINCYGLHQHKGFTYVDGEAIMNGEAVKVWKVERKNIPKPKADAQTTPAAPAPSSPEGTPSPPPRDTPPPQTPSVADAPPVSIPPAPEPAPLEVPPDGGW